jgi:hypothetical protein
LPARIIEISIAKMKKFIMFRGTSIQVVRGSSPLWSFSLIHHKSVKWTSTYFPQPFNLLNVNPVLHCNTAPDFSLSLLLQVYVILPFTVPYRLLCRQYYIIKKWLVVLTDNKWNSRLFVVLKVEHWTLNNERSFLWRRSEQSGHGTHWAIQTVLWYRFESLSSHCTAWLEMDQEHS